MSRVRFLRDQRGFPREGPHPRSPPEETNDEEKEERSFDNLLDAFDDASPSIKKTAATLPGHPSRPSRPLGLTENIWTQLAEEVDVRAATEEEMVLVRDALRDGGHIDALEAALMIPDDAGKWGVAYLTDPDPDGRRDWLNECAAQLGDARTRGFPKSEQIMATLLDAFQRLAVARAGLSNRLI